MPHRDLNPISRVTLTHMILSPCPVLLIHLKVLPFSLDSFLANHFVMPDFRQQSMCWVFFVSPLFMTRLICRTLYHPFGKYNDAATSRRRTAGAEYKRKLGGGVCQPFGYRRCPERRARRQDQHGRRKIYSARSVVVGSHHVDRA